MNSNEEILDGSPKKEQNPIREMILWWEYRRILYNVLIILYTAIILYLWEFLTVRWFGVSKVATNFIIFLFILNVCYTISWIVGFISLKFLKGTPYNSMQRWIIFSVGTAFALLLTTLHHSFV